MVAVTLAPSLALAQQSCTNGMQVVGTVTDPTGAVIPGAQVQAAGGEKTIADAAGQYVLPCVPATSTAITAQADGFARGTSLMVQGRNKEAIKTMTDLNIILRSTLQRKSPEKVPFAEELRIVESYLAIQQVRFAGRLDIKIDATPEALDGLVPCFLLQPLVENAIQPGIAPLEADGLIEADVRRVGDMLGMEVKDNGCGPNGSDTKGHGIGMQNIREHLSYFYPDAYRFDAVAPRGGG
jgi:Carboxypeptidase regulatory-like domain/Histidine kinase